MCFDGEVEDRDYVRFVSRAIMQRINLLMCESARRVEDAQATVAAHPRWPRDVRDWLPTRA